MWGTGSGGASRERDLDGRVVREGVDAAGRKKVLGGVGPGDDLQQDRDGRGSERCTVDEEVRSVLWGDGQKDAEHNGGKITHEVEGQVDVEVSTTLNRGTGLHTEIKCQHLAVTPDGRNYVPPALRSTGEDQSHRAASCPSGS